MARNRPVTYRARGGESLCHLAAAYGFPHCQRLRDANPPLADRNVLRRRDVVTIPEREEGEDGGPDRSRNRFRRPNYPPPNVWFIKETGDGYPDPVPAPGDRGYNPHYPNGDPKLRVLAVTNYHVEKAGDGTQAFAADNFYGHDLPSSQDPDHFKVQVYDNKVANGVNEVTVTLHAMRPSYRQVQVRGAPIIRWTSSYYYPATADRKLTVTCRRVGQTNYFRSPYLRLVTTETDRTARSRQCLLVKDYYDDGADDTQKRFTEILHHKVRAVYDVQMCTAHKCQVLKDASISVQKEVRLAIHILRGSAATEDQSRKMTYKWMRRLYAQAHVRPHLKVLHTVDVPENMITVSDGDGRHASGEDGATPPGRSEMTITINGTDYTHRPGRGDSPRTTAAALARLLTRNRFRVRGPYRVKVDGLAPARGEVSSPYEILVFDRNNAPVAVDSVSSTDRPNAAGRRGQQLTLTDDTDEDDFRISWPYAHRDQRSAHYNYRTSHFDYFVVGTQLRDPSDGSTPRGFSPYGSYGGRTNADIGPIVFVNESAMDEANLPFTVSHELLHPLMHVHHTVGATGNSELMFGGGTSTADSKDATKHIADAPIGITYTIMYRNSSENVVLNGQQQVLSGGGRLRDTPVDRFHRVAGHYRKMGRPEAPRSDRG